MYQPPKANPILEFELNAVNRDISFNLLWKTFHKMSREQLSRRGTEIIR